MAGVKASQNQQSGSEGVLQTAMEALHHAVGLGVVRRGQLALDAE
jgi:hypothetical protein